MTDERELTADEKAFLGSALDQALGRNAIAVDLADAMKAAARKWANENGYSLNGATFAYLDCAKEVMKLLWPKT